MKQSTNNIDIKWFLYAKRMRGQSRLEERSEITKCSHNFKIEAITKELHEEPY